MKNPKRALNAFNAPAATPVGTYEVQEFTLGLAGVLEAIGSPLSTGERIATVEEWAPTLFACTRPPETSRKLLASGGVAAFEHAARAWADALPIATGRSLIRTVTDSLNRLNGVDPDGGDADGEAGAEGNALAAGQTAG